MFSRSLVLSTPRNDLIRQPQSLENGSNRLLIVFASALDAKHSWPSARSRLLQSEVPDVDWPRRLTMNYRSLGNIGLRPGVVPSSPSGAASIRPDMCCSQASMR